LLFFGGALSHVVAKRPVPGEFRVQVQYGGGYVALAEPPAGALALAERTLAAIGEDLLYARIDMARDADGGWLLMEAELIEPDFYLASAPEGGRRFAAAVRARLSSGAHRAPPGNRQPLIPITPPPPAPAAPPSRDTGH
ncbi:MAG: hypothetical protein ACXW3O_11765, partial [Brevundimonas sp.]